MKIKTFTLRLTEEQLDYVDEKAKELGVSKNDYIRRLIDADADVNAENDQYKELESEILHTVNEIRERLQDILDNQKK